MRGEGVDEIEILLLSILYNDNFLVFINYHVGLVLNLLINISTASGNASIFTILNYHFCLGFINNA